MKINFSDHSLIRAKERNIDRKILINAINFSDKVDVSNKNSKRFIIKKIYRNQLDKEHLLMIICEEIKNDEIYVITIIDTSKISKYF